MVAGARSPSLLGSLYTHYGPFVGGLVDLAGLRGSAFFCAAHAVFLSAARWRLCEAIMLSGIPPAFLPSDLWAS